MSQLVHVILPSGTRHERTFPDDASPDKILKALESIKLVFGFNGTVLKPDPNHPIKPRVDFGDPASGFVWDNPETRVIVLKSEEVRNQGILVETRALLDEKGLPITAKQLKGPVEKPPEPEAVESEPTEPDTDELETESEVQPQEE